MWKIGHYRLQRHTLGNYIVVDLNLQGLYVVYVSDSWRDCLRYTLSLFY